MAFALPLRVRNRLASWALTALGANQNTVYRYLHALTESTEARLLPDLSTYQAQADAYRVSPFVHEAISLITTAAAPVRFNVFARQGENKIPQVDHPIERLLAAPNPWQDSYEFFEASYGFLKITGNCYWFLSGEPGGAPRELYVLRPDRVRIVPGRDHTDFIRGYVYTVDGLDVPFEGSEIIHFKRFHPLSDFYGLSDLEAAGLAAMTDKKMAEWNYNWFNRRNITPPGLVNIKELVSDDDFERIRKEWEESYGGAERRTAFVRGATVEWQQLGAGQRDMEFRAGREYERSVIYHVFHIPAGMVDPSATEANARTSYELFTRDTVWPVLVAFGRKMTKDLAPFFGTDLVIEPEDIRHKDMAAMRAEIETAAAYQSINEIRQQYYSKPAVAWGNLPAVGPSANPNMGKPREVIQRIVRDGYEQAALAARPPQSDAIVTASQPGPILADPDGGQDAPEHVKALAHLTLTGAARLEIRQFATRFAKAEHFGDSTKIDAFTFLYTPEPLADALKTWARRAADPAAFTSLFHAGEGDGVIKALVSALSYREISQ